jgi:hypothetical protein
MPHSKFAQSSEKAAPKAGFTKNPRKQPANKNTGPLKIEDFLNHKKEPKRKVKPVAAPAAAPAAVALTDEQKLARLNQALANGELRPELRGAFAARLEELKGELEFEFIPKKPLSQKEMRQLEKSFERVEIADVPAAAPVYTPARAASESKPEIPLEWDESDLCEIPLTPPPSPR